MISARIENLTAAALNALDLAYDAQNISDARLYLSQALTSVRALRGSGAHVAEVAQAVHETLEHHKSKGWA